MLGTQFYHESVRTAVAVFGSLFNNIVIQRRDGKVVPVPIAYGPRVKWLDAQGQLTQSVEMFENLLPRMSYELTGMKYDTNRKLNNKQTVIGESALLGGRGPRVNAPVPYSLSFTLYIQTKNLNDGWQIIEQILPFFQPAYTVRVRCFPDTPQFGGNHNITLMPLNEYDMPITLEDVTWNDNYADGEIQERRDVEWELKFETKIHLWGPVVPATIIYDARAAIGILGENESIQAAQIDQLSDIVETGYYNQDPVWSYNDSDSTPHPMVKLQQGEGSEYILYTNAAPPINDRINDPRYASTAGAGRFLLPSQAITWADTTQPAYTYLQTYTSYDEFGINGTDPRTDPIYFAKFSNISPSADSDGFYTASLQYFRRDPTINPADQKLVHPIIVDVSDSDGGINRVVRPLNL